MSETTTDLSISDLQQVRVADNSVQLAEKFTYPRSHLACTGGSESEILRGIAVARECIVSKS